MGKRLADLLWLPVGMVVFLPIAIVVAAAIWIDDGRPLFFRQWRLGRGRRPFRLLKFRTMRDGAVTRVGAWLRRTGLDELPQFANVALGDMSFVGPRPLTPDDVHRLGWCGPHHDFRWRVPPGITGRAQVRAGAGARASLAWDRLYVRRQNAGLDAMLVAIAFAMNLFGKAWVKRTLLRTQR